MKKILNSEQMRIYENNTIDKIGVDGVVLMERAALAVTNSVVSSFARTSGQILIIAGTGNNGADGLCIARQLMELGYKTDIYINWGHSESELFKKQKNILDNLGQIFVDDIIEKYDLVIDALLGIGIKGQIDDNTSNIILKINNMKAYVISIDIPSGLNSTTGLPSPYSIIANTTITFGAYKTGLFLNQAVNFTGDIKFNQVGMFDCDINYDYLMLDSSDLNFFETIRVNNSNKGTYGKVLIVAGSKSVCGCAILAARASLKIGSGMVKIVTHEKNYSAINISLPEAMITCYDDNGLAADEIKKAIGWCDTIMCGPGIGSDQYACELVKLCISSDKSLVLDADALNCIAQDSDIGECLISRGNLSPFNTVITPHKSELKRLLKAFNCNDSFALSKCLKLVVVEKDANTLIIGNESYINSTGNNGMSTAGSGDVLAGIMASMFALRDKGLINDSIEKVAAYAVYLHGNAGDIAASRIGQASLIASNIIDAL